MAIIRLIINIFVDNIKVIDIKRLGYIEKVKLKLVAAFKIIDINPISFYLRLKVKRNQAKKILKLL